MRKLYLFFSVVLFASCTQLNYLGSSYPPTENVDVFVTQSSVKKPYDVIGKGYIQETIGPRISIEAMQRRAVEKARLKGANAVIIEDYYLVDKSSSITSKIDSTRNLTQAANISPAVSSGFTILFIRYKD